MPRPKADPAKKTRTPAGPEVAQWIPPEIAQAKEPIIILHTPTLTYTKIGSGHLLLALKRLGQPCLPKRWWLEADEKGAFVQQGTVYKRMEKFQERYFQSCIRRADERRAEMENDPKFVVLSHYAKVPRDADFVLIPSSSPEARALPVSGAVDFGLHPFWKPYRSLAYLMARADRWYECYPNPPPLSPRPTVVELKAALKYAKAYEKRAGMIPRLAAYKAAYDAAYEHVTRAIEARRSQGHELTVAEYDADPTRPQPPEPRRRGRKPGPAPAAPDRPEPAPARPEPAEGRLGQGDGRIGSDA